MRRRKPIYLLLAGSLLLATTEPTFSQTEIKTEPAVQIIEKVKVTTTHEYYDGTLPELINNDDRFLTLARALEVAQLNSLLEDKTYTIFAPTNVAFTHINQAKYNALFDNQEKMRQFLFSHIAEGRYDLADIIERSYIPSVSGESIDIDILNGLEIEEHKLVRTNIVTQNGIIHLIDGVIPTHDIDI